MRSIAGIDRRRFLLASAAPLALTGQAKRQRAAAISPLEFKKRLRGPILSAPTVYNVDYAIDHQGTRRMVERAASAGVSVFTLTRGNNQYDQLAYEEIKALTRTMADATRGRGLFIAATGAWWTGQAADYAQFAESLGADAVQVAPPTASDDAYVKHLETVARSVRIALVLHGQPSLGVLRRLQSIDSLVAIKEEFTTDYTIQIYREFGDRWNIFAGGTKTQFLTYRPYGMQAYYSRFATFAPEIAMLFWRGRGKGQPRAGPADYASLRRSLFERWNHAFWRATLECFGAASRYQRPPAETYSDQQMIQVKAFYQSLGLL